jgi:hypothetical protein
VRVGRGAGSVGGVLARAADMAVLLQLSGVRVDKPPVIDLTPADPIAFWQASRVSNPRQVRVIADDPGFEGPGWRKVELEGDSEGPGSHAGSRQLRATANLSSAGAGAPLVIIVHGYAIPFTGYDRWLAWRMRRGGLHTIRIDLPFHLRRTAPRAHSGDGFFSIDPVHTRAVIRQSVEDVAALVAWARAEVTPTVRVLGTSLGGLISLLSAALMQLDWLVGAAPLCDLPVSCTQRPPGAMQRHLGMLGEGEGHWGPDRVSAQRALEGAFAPLVPRNFTPLTPGARITLIRPDHDLIVGPGPIDELAAAWGTELWSYPHGHITLMNAPGVPARVCDRLIHPGFSDHEGLRLAG